MFDGTSPAGWSIFAPAFPPLARRLLVYFCSGAYTPEIGSSLRLKVMNMRDHHDTIARRNSK
jgi:hypothetical protein